MHLWYFEFVQHILAWLSKKWFFLTNVNYLVHLQISINAEVTAARYGQKLKYICSTNLTL